MKTQFTRRSFLKGSVAAGVALGLPRLAMGVGSPNSDVRLAIVGLGGIDVPGSVGGRGRTIIGDLKGVPGHRIVALCDVDKAILDHGVELLKKQGQTVKAYGNYRQVLDDKEVDAVILATPNHWHALGTIWGCQAGKDVYVEKPFSYNLWEGRQMVAAARKYNRLVQVGTQRRSSVILPQIFEYLRSGQLGKMSYAHALVFRARASIGKVTSPTPVPATVDYDQWCGPIAKGPVMREQFHYHWHWFWETGNGEIGNNGVHMMDICRWGLGQNAPPPRAMSIGGRFAWNDNAETANAQIAFFDYAPVPMICEIRDLSEKTSQHGMGKFRGQDKGIIMVCEGGYFAGDMTGGAIYDHQGKKLKDFQDGRKQTDIDKLHLGNFIEAVRSRKQSDLHAEAVEGQRSAACCHMANISHRLGKQAGPGAIQEIVKANSEMADTFERYREYLRDNGVDLEKTPATLGPWVTYDAKQEKFVKEFAGEANALCRREYRKPYEVPEIVG